VRYFFFFFNKRYLYFILELCRGGDLFGLLCKKERVVEKDARFYAATVLKAFGYMHERNIIYRDLKPENLLITENGYLKVADLGLAKAVPEGVTYTMCGTPVYMAPEMLLSTGHGKPADAWAIGIMIYELCGGYPPFEGEDQMATYELIINANVTWPAVGSSITAAVKSDNNDEAVNLSDLWGSSGEIVNQYKFGTSMKELIVSLLRKDPTKRTGGSDASKKPFEDVMKARWFSGFDWNSFEKQKLRPPAVPHVGDWRENFEQYDKEEEAVEYEGNDFDEFDL
jgi:serine/threonine protein kinase